MLAEGRLIIIWRFSVDNVVVSGLMRREYDRVKLHLTLINTLFRKDQGVGVGDNNAFLSSRELTPSSHVMQW